MPPEIGEFQVWTGSSWATVAPVPSDCANIVNKKLQPNLPVIPNEMYVHASWPDWRKQIAPLYAALVASEISGENVDNERAAFDSLIEQWSTFAAVSGNSEKVSWNNMPTGQIFKLATPKRFAEEYMCNFSNKP